MPGIGPGNKPIAFGATGYFVTRIVKPGTTISVLYERYAEIGQVGYRTQMRASGKLLAVTSNGSPLVSDAPVKFLQNASS
jgi:HK97 family phage major capsid protein